MATVTLFTDDFNGTVGDALEVYSATWVKHPSSVGTVRIADGGTYKAAQNPESNQGVYRKTTAPPQADYSVTGTIIRNGNATAYGGICARMSSTANTFYTARYATLEAQVQLYKFVNGTSTLLGSASSTLNVGVGRALRLEAIGSAIKVYEDGSSTPSISVTDTSITSAGFAGIRLNGSIMDVDSLTATYESSGGATNYSITADVGSYALTGIDASLIYTPASDSRSIVADVGSYALSGSSALTPVGRSTVGAFGDYAQTGQDASLKVARLLAGEFGEYTLNGSDASLTATGAVAYSLAVDFGQYAITGVSASLIGPADQNADTHDGYFAKQWRKAAEQSKRKIEALEDQLEEIQEQIEEVKDAPEPKRPVLIESVPVPPFEAKAKIIEALIEQAARIRAEIDDEEVLLLL